VIESFNSVVTTLFSTILQPLQGVAPVWGLLTISLLAGVLLVVIYGEISNQAALKRVKKGIAAGIYESVLFRHDLRTSLRAQLAMLFGGARYFALAVPPLIVLLIPSLVILAQLNLRYGARSLQPGEEAIVSIVLKNEDALFATELIPNNNLLRVTPPLRDLDARSVSWRVDAVGVSTQDRPATLALVVNGVRVDQPIFTGLQPVTLPTSKHSASWWQFLYPGASVPQELRSEVRDITVGYPELVLRVAGIEVNWLLLFAAVSILSGLVVSRAIGIEV
jgi:hypothetical protein